MISERLCVMSHLRVDYGWLVFSAHSGHSFGSPGHVNIHHPICFLTHFIAIYITPVARSLYWGMDFYVLCTQTEETLVKDCANKHIKGPMKMSSIPPFSWNSITDIVRDFFFKGRQKALTELGTKYRPPKLLYITLIHWLFKASSKFLKLAMINDNFKACQCWADIKI